MTASLQIIIICVLIILSAILSGSETGIYRLSRLHLKIGLERGKLSFALLDRLVSDSQGVIFSILIGNNIVNYLATSLVTYLILARIGSETAAEYYATLIMVPVLFVFGDLLPKNLFFYLSDRLMPRTAPLMFIIHKLFVSLGIIRVLKAISVFIAKIAGVPGTASQAASPAQRQYIRQLLHDTREEGILSSVQADIIERLVNIPSIQSGTVMVPLDKVIMVPADTDRAALFARLKSSPFRHYPVYKDKRTDILGFINIYEVLSSESENLQLETFVKPLERVSVSVPVIELLNRMRNERLEMVLVCRTDRGSNQVPVGIVTIKDLVEELIGELSQW
jgi:putative hemolysin